MIPVSTKNTMELIQRFDDMKAFLPSMNPKFFLSAVKSDSFDMFTMFYLMNSYFGDIHSVEPEAIDYIECSEQMRMKLKTISSVLTKDAVWTNVFAFNAFACAVNNVEFTVGEIEDLSAEQILWAVITIGAIEGSMNLPFSNSVLVSIAGWLKIDGWTVPPLALLFTNFKNMFDDHHDETEEVENVFGDLSMSQLAFEASVTEIKEPHLVNYLGRNKIVSEYVVVRISNLSECWGASISKSKD